MSINEVSETDQDSNKNSGYLAKIQKYRSVIRHIKNVQQIAEELSEKLIENGELELAKQLIARAMAHDNSKLTSPIEWDSLHRGEELLDLAHTQHVKTNDHHPEYWAGGMNAMPEICLIEWVCDVKARSDEFGTDLRAWIKETALPRYGVSPKGKTYKIIKKYLDLILEQPF